MANGRAHDRWNLFWLALMIAYLISRHLSLFLLCFFILGFFLSTFIFSPDTDLGPKKRVGVVGVILYPYQFFFKHRGFSHSLLWGTFTRIIYLLVVGALFTIILRKMGYLNFDVSDYLSFLKSSVENYNYKLWEYKLLTWFFLGHFFSDFSHIILDRIYSFIKRWLL